jgi:DNA-binding transcriptional LysR family regulator
MDIDRLKVFIDAAQTLSFSKTAQQLHVTQPTVSKYIRDLEKSLSVRLFERSGAGLSLTEAGRALLPAAHHLLIECNKFQDLAKSLESEVSGRIRIACTTASGKYILPQLAARFRNLHPLVQMSILSCTQEGAIERMLEEDADLGVVSYEITSDRLECQHFFTDQIILIVPSNHPWVDRSYIELGEILDEPLILRESTSGTRRSLLTELARHDIKLDDLSIFLEVGNAEAIVSTVASEVGVSFVSRMSAISFLDDHLVLEVPIQGVTLQRGIFMARRSIDTPNRARDVFWGFIHDPTNDDLYRKTKAS